MKTLISLLAFMIPSILWGEMICPLIDGCPIKKGICIGCIEKPKEDLIKPIIQSKKVQLEETKRKPIVKAKPTKQKWWSGTLFKCVVGCLYPYWDSEGNDYDKDGNLVLKSSSNTKKKFRNEKGLWMCWEPELGWPDMNTGKPTGEYRECGWRDRGSRTAEAVERGIKECGELMNWVWLDEHHTKYRCLSSYAYKPKRTCSQKWECIVPPCDFIDENGCLIE